MTLESSQRAGARLFQHLVKVVASPVRWRAAVFAIAAAAVAVRLVIISHSHGGSDLRIYTYFARLALHGMNPFAPPAGGEFPPLQSDNPPLEIAAFAGLLGIHDSPTTLRLLFALADAAVILFIGLCFDRSKQWRGAFVLFYAFNPFALVAWTAFAEDKSIVFLGIVIWLWAIERQKEWTTWLTAAGLTAFKFVGVYAVPILALRSLRRNRAAALWPLAFFAASFALSYVPWFPQSIDTFTRRNIRLATNPPIHASWTLILSRIGIYAPIEAKVLSVLAIIIVFVFYERGWIDARESIVWSVFAGFVFLPNNAFNRLLLITVPFLLLLNPTRRQWITIWLVSAVSALAAGIATRGVPHALSPIAGLLTTLFAHESTVRHVLWMNLLPAVVLTFYFRDRNRKRSELATKNYPARASASDPGVRTH